MNCGFVSWVDDEWPIVLKNCLKKLWEKYHDSNNAWIDERVQNAQVLKDLADEKNKTDKKYTALLADVDRFIGQTVPRVHTANYQMIMSNIEEEVHKTKQENDELKNQVDMLKTEVSEVKQTLKAQADVMRAKMQE